MPCNDCNHHSQYLRLPRLHWSNSTQSFITKAWLQIQFPDSGKLKSHKSLLQHFSSVVAFCRTAVFFANSIFCNSFSFRAKVKDQSITKSINKSCIFSTPPKNYNWSLIFFSTGGENRGERQFTFDDRCCCCKDNKPKKRKRNIDPGPVLQSFTDLLITIVNGELLIGCIIR